MPADVGVHVGDDLEGLPEELRAVLESVLAGEYNNARLLRDALKQAFLKLPELGDSAPAY